MTASTRALARHGVTITDTELADELSRALEVLPGAAGSDTLTGHEAVFLAAHGGGNAARLIAEFDPAEVHRQQAMAAADATARLLRGLLTREAAAELLGVDSTGVSRRIQDGRLWALPRRGRRIPSWQIQSGQLLPGLSTVVAAIPTDAHPLSVEGMMTTPQDDLGGDTPIAFLLSGGSPELVAELIGELDRW